MKTRQEYSRQLAAILFSDIAGYSAMMQADEAMALDIVRRFEQVLQRTVPEHEGEVYQFSGDGCLCIFPSATHAVQCAYAMQQQWLNEPPGVPVKCGIHVGEIYTEGGKIYGDAVNVTSRIDSIAQSGTILFSKEVFEKIRNHALLQAALLGSYHFKNITEPLTVYYLINEGVQKPDPKTIEGKLKATEKPGRSRWTIAAVLLGILLVIGYFVFREKWFANTSAESISSIAVLPFKNLTTGEDEDLLSIGLAEDILTQLAQIRDLRVISSSSCFQYKDSEKPIRTIARELGVSNIIEGSVRLVENDLRVSIKLTDGRTDELIWAEEFDRDFDDVLNLQREVAMAVSNKLKVALTPDVQMRLSDKVNVNPEAYMLYRRGREALHRTSGTKQDVEKAMQYFEQAIGKDSLFANAWAGLADAWMESIFWHRQDPLTIQPKIQYAAMKALEIDPMQGEAYSTLGSLAYEQKAFAESEYFLRKAVEYNPNSSFAYERLAWLAMMQHEDEECIDYLLRSIELNPNSTRFQGALGNAYAGLRQYPEGIKAMERFLVAEPTDNFLLWACGYLHFLKGDYARTIELLNKRSIGRQSNWVLGYAYAKTGRRDLAEQILEHNLERDKTEAIPQYMIAVQMMGLGRKEDAIDYLERALTSFGENYFISVLETDPIFRELAAHPRFQRILDEKQRIYKL